MNIVDKIDVWLTEDMELNDEEYEIVRYGIHQGIALLINIITLLVIGISMNALWQALIFLIFFWPIRIYAGGYHANTRIRCYIFSSVIEIFVIYIIKYVKIHSGVLAIGILLFCILIYKVCPMENTTKKLEDIEYVIYKKKVFWLLIIYEFAFLFSYVCQLEDILKIIFLALGVIFLLLFLGLIKYGRVERKYF